CALGRQRRRSSASTLRSRASDASSWLQRSLTSGATSSGFELFHETLMIGLERRNVQGRQEARSPVRDRAQEDAAIVSIARSASVSSPSPASGDREAVTGAPPRQSSSRSASTASARRSRSGS